LEEDHRRHPRPSSSSLLFLNFICFFILQAYANIKVGLEALASLVGLDGNNDDDDDDDDDDETRRKIPNQQALELQEVLDAANSLPKSEFRCQTAKLLVECAALLKEESKLNVLVRQETNPKPHKSNCAFKPFPYWVVCWRKMMKWWKFGS
jgi:hypothetical protein